MSRQREPSHDFQVHVVLPGEGGIFFNPTSDYRSLNFAGEVMRENLSMPIPAGFSVRSPLLPQRGQLHEQEAADLFDDVALVDICLLGVGDRWIGGLASEPLRQAVDQALAPGRALPAERGPRFRGQV